MTGPAIVALLLLMIAALHARELAAPEYLVNAGGLVDVPITLDDATGIASAHVQLNFDATLLNLLQVNPGPLGKMFDLAHEERDGVVTLILSRPENLASGSGILVSLRFRFRAGAEEGVSTEIAIANCSFSDSSGVVDMNQKESVTVGGGTLRVSNSPTIDNAANGIPDWWEIGYGLDPFLPNATLDHEGDGHVGLVEFAFGGNPNANDAAQRSPLAGLANVNGQIYPTIQFSRRESPESGVAYRIQESPDLLSWTLLDPAPLIIGTPISLGDGCERVTFRGTVPATGPGAAQRSFLRILVESQ